MAKDKSNYLDGTVYSKANILISAKYHSTITENKIMALALSDQKRMIKDKGGTIRVKIPAHEIKTALGGNSGSFYTLLKETAKQMNSRQIGIVNEANGQFAFFQIIQTCIYDQGELNITFNSDLSKYIKDIQGQFTLLNLPVMLSFKSEYSFRLYEILRSRAYNRDPKSNNDTWEVRFSLSELQLQLGIVNAEDSNAKKVLSYSENPDYDKAVQVAKDKKESLTQWMPFKKTVLNKAQKEINEKTEINIEYTPVRGGVGGKIQSVIFKVTLKNKKPEEKYEETLKEVSMDDFYDAVVDVIDEKLKMADIKTLAECSGCDINKVKKAYKLAKSQKKGVENLIGFMKAAIEEGYEEPVVAEPKKKKNNFQNFEGRKYDFDALEKEAQK